MITTTTTAHHDIFGSAVRTAPVTTGRTISLPNPFRAVSRAISARSAALARRRQEVRDHGRLARRSDHPVERRGTGVSWYAQHHVS